jgi:hypothetical protein
VASVYGWNARLAFRMNTARWSVSLLSIAGIVAATLAAATIWLLVSDPVRGADTVSALSQGNPGPFMQAIGAVIYDALRGLFRFL